VSWDESSVLAAGDTVEFCGTLWILYLAECSDVGIGKTSDFHTEKGSVRSYTKQNLGLEDPGVPTLKQGYKAISRKSVTDADGNQNVINNKHKTDWILSLTSLGKDLMKVINVNDNIRTKLKESIDAEIERPVKPWWPGEGPQETFPVYLRTFADKAVLEASEVTILAIASFECGRCKTTVKGTHWVKLTEGNIEVGEWSRFTSTECSCGLTYRHPVADPRQSPSPE
jgi:hypothetical protein